MHELKSTPKRYQNPEVFELLAMEYAVGALQGRARERFEVLMDTHFYLRATVDAYQAKFANLVELLPEQKPSDKVWNNIEAHIAHSEKVQTTATTQAKVASTVAEEKTPWWKLSFVQQGLSFAAMALIAVTVYFYDPMTNHNSSAIASYTAAMEYQENGKHVAVTKIKKSDMKLSIDIMKPVKVADGMELTLWCNPKKGGKPMKMGTISKTGMTELTISKEEWGNLKNIGSLAVTVEKQGKNIVEPSGNVILKGQLSPDQRWVLFNNRYSM